MRKKKGCLSRLRRALQAGVAAALSASTLGAGAARAASYTWDGGAPGGGGNAKWSNANNWGVPDAANVAPPTGSAGLTNSDLFFGGVLKTAPQMDNPYSLHTLTFNSGPSGFTLGSQQNPPNAERLTTGTGGIINNSVNVQIINSPLSLGAAQTWNAGSGGLRFGETVALGTHSLMAGGGFTTAVSGSIDASDFDPDSDLFLPDLPNGWGWDKSGLPVTGQILAIPEPATLTLLGISLLALGYYSVRRRS